MNGSTINLAQLLDRLGYTDDERFQLCSKKAGHLFAATVLPLSDAQGAERRADLLADWWFGVNPVTEVDTGRPAAGDVTRLAGIWADLDIKPGGCPTWEVAQRIVDELESVLGERTVAVTRSGHGLQPIWAIDEAGILGDTIGSQRYKLGRSEARALLRRWGRLVAAVAERFGARVDTVFDLPRILRVPNTVNHKAAPIPVVTIAGEGAPISVERILEVLDQLGIDDRPEDHDDPGTIVSAPAEWAWARSTCGYAELTMRGWARDEPTDRHPWLVAQATRIACMHRYGCLNEMDYQRAVERLITRFRVLLGRSGADREPGRGEISDALGWGQQRAAAMSDARLAEELGGHTHKAPTLSNGERSGDASARHLQGDRGGREGSASYGASGRGLANRSADSSNLAGRRSTAGHKDREARPTLRELIAQAEASEAPAATVSTWAPPEPAEVDETLEQKQLRIDVADQAYRLQVSDEARKIEQQRKAGNVEIPRPMSGSAFLARPLNPIKHRIAGLLPIGGKIIVSAQFKSGKSTMMGNLLRSLTDGDPFLGCFEVTPFDGRVVLIDDELDDGMLQHWLTGQGITRTDRFDVVSLRGRVSAFDITNDSIRAEWAHNLREANCAFLIFDCLRPVLDAIGLSEDKESGTFLVALDALARDAGISEMAIVHHMGHGSERARGDSRLRDWPDVEWKIVREQSAEDDPAAPKYFSAFGRGDVEIKEGALKLEGRRLTFSPGEGRKKGSGHRETDLPPAPGFVEQLLSEVAEPMNKLAIRRALRDEGYTDRAARDAIELLIGRGFLATTRGPRHSTLVSWTEPGAGDPVG